MVEHLEVGGEVLHTGAQRPALPGGRLEQQPGRPVLEVVAQHLQQRQQSLTDLTHRGVGAALGDAGAGVHDDALGPDLRGPLEVVRHHAGRALVRRRRGAAQVDQVGGVDEHAHPGLGGGLAEGGVHGRVALAERPAARVAGEDLEGLRADPSGLGEGALDQALADLEVGADRVPQGRGEGGRGGGHGRSVGAGRGHTRKRVTTLPSGAIDPWSGSELSTNSSPT